MDRWRGKVAVVTGATAGIGEAIVRDLTFHGVRVAALARRKELLEKMESELNKGVGEMKGLQCDVTKEEEILAAFKWIEGNWGPVHIIINNAGIFIGIVPGEGKTEDWKRLIDTNIIGPSVCSREGLKSMKAHGIEEGHIININSIAGDRILRRNELSFYSATKHALTALTAYLRKQVSLDNLKIKVTTLSPGLVKTEGTGSAFDFESIPHLLTSDISQAVIYILSTPKRVNISKLTIQPIGEIY